MRALRPTVRTEDTRSFRPIAESDGYWPWRSTTQRPLNAASWHTSQRSLPTMTDEARSLKPKRWKSGTVRLVLKDRPWKPSRS